MSGRPFKRRYVASYEVFQAKRWEGKSLGFQLRYLFSNHPEVALCTFGFFVLFPALCTLKQFTFNEEKNAALKKYKSFYTVVRDDDPNIADVIKEKECGRQYFPQ